eukprot:TRINITY_DN35802_c0_g1_i1.p1 TRINITY_DN35802_c0_g1~~TRINITY_DN35802_c0_g1_i1.p1  ORF type:complete len:253 (+),score=62.19 TRINITY_DN35802_c0_g1_i1:70-759(+)
MSHKRKFNETVVEENASEFEKKHVHDVYSKIAGHFSATRYKAWPKVGEFVGRMEKGSFICDVGAGNGKSLAGPLEEGGRVLMATDASRELLSVADEKGIEAQAANALQLPYRPGTMDCAINIAMLHHLATPSRRKAVLVEMGRVLRPSGRLLIYVWAAGQKRFAAAASQDVTVPWTLHDRFDAATPTHDRYYHLFTKGELEELIESTGAFTITESYYDCDNWCVAAVKN